MADGVALSIPGMMAYVRQEGLLERAYHDGLFPNLIYRQEAPFEEWPANTGQDIFMTKPGLLAPIVEPIQPGAEPPAQEFPWEQWTAHLAQIPGSIDIHMPTSVVSNANLFLRKIKQLGLQAGQSINRVARNALFKAYLSGQTNLIAGAGAGDTSIRVAALNGFIDVVDPTAEIRPVPPGPANPLAIVIMGATPIKANVIGYVADNPKDPYGPGTLILQAAVGGAGAPIRSPVLSAVAPLVMRASGGYSVDAISPADTLVLQTLINAVAFLRDANVQPHDDGLYHAHISAGGNAQLFADPVYQGINKSLPEGSAYSSGFVGSIAGIAFYMNNETPTTTNTGARQQTGNKAMYSPEIGAETTNEQGVNIGRVIITGQGAIYERGLDEGQYVTEAGLTGKAAEFDVVNNGVSVSTERIRLYLRAPVDKLGQIVTATWSITTSFPVPSDITAPSGPQRFKRAVVVEYAA